MGKGFNNYMTKKFFHPASKDNIKRVWMAQQKTEYEKKKQEELMTQYQKEQEMLSNRALLGDEKAKAGLSFLYDAPPGLKKKEKEDNEPEYKFEWQRKYNAPREAFAKGDETISDQPFGIEVRNIRCIKCRQWGHVNTDKICPLFGKNLTAEPPQPATSTSSLLEGLKQDGFQLKQTMLGRLMESSDKEVVLADEDETDPEVQFLKSLTPKQKKKLLKKLNKLQKKDSEKKKKRKSRHSSDSDSSDAHPKQLKRKSDESHHFGRKHPRLEGRSPPDGREYSKCGTERRQLAHGAHSNSESDTSEPDRSRTNNRSERNPKLHSVKQEHSSGKHDRQKRRQRSRSASIDRAPKKGSRNDKDLESSHKERRSRH
ncbi:hypothetical protein C0Q70_09240 [Pomacea canaliculata]|uniref:CBF1-interacting co-repressor CIR N-terminal domain-containing protein n=1 Tax=Pomacea canaliculata TaxID=400727 RepID=A0A2T7P991_POMCA|nr:corepressor interacting with RBPJ 1-like [Pomacea canaliculata]PVD29979.1 hypothetical protein C0Q70_09240 [Pomacea canaliculata]